MNVTHCPLCDQPQAAHTPLFARDAWRHYRRCEHCSLVWVPPAFFLSAADEKAEYDLHENSVSDPGYRRFLSRLADPLSEYIARGASGLDFGCGPAPALARLLQARGCQVALYDPFYYPDHEVLLDTYDFITASEVLEHLHWPGREMARLWSLLRPGGILGVMTKRVTSQQAFLRWHYKNDPTHVCFFSDVTFSWWAQAHGAQLHLPGPDTALLVK